jgi:hypothetical protein
MYFDFHMARHITGLYQSSLKICRIFDLAHCRRHQLRRGFKLLDVEKQDVSRWVSTEALCMSEEEKITSVVDRGLWRYALTLARHDRIAARGWEQLWRNLQTRRLTTFKAVFQADLLSRRDRL